MPQSFNERCNPLICAGWACACVVWYICLFAGISASFRNDHWSEFAFLGAALVIGVPVVGSLYSILAFPLRYSVFGRLKRTQPPKDGCLFVLYYTWGRVGALHSTIPFVTWRVFPTGIGIHQLGTGTAFLPRAAVTSITYNWLGQCVIRHSCGELRSPVAGPAAIGKTIAAHWPPVADGCVARDDS